MPAFEYFFGVNLGELEANELGAQGWELVAIFTAGPDRSNEVFWFKRQKRQA